MNLYRKFAISSHLTALSTNAHWSGGLKFSCTGCGKCCQNEGEVWFDTDEFADLVTSLNLSAKDVLAIYVEEVKSGWVKLKSKRAKVGTDEVAIERCIFLSNDGKSCTIYENRPIQCRTYPYWPKLMDNVEEWINEAVVPEDQEGKHQLKGCNSILT
jgi:Fe-S-cluster containining protein